MISLSDINEEVTIRTNGNRQRSVKNVMQMIEMTVIGLLSRIFIAPLCATGVAVISAPP